MWKSVLSISKVFGKAVGGFFRRLFHRPSFPRPTPLFLRGEAQRFEEFAFGLLHAGCGIGVAEGASDALQSVDAEPLAQILGRFIQSQQGLQWSLIAFVTDAFAALLIDLNVGLGAGAMVVQIGIQVLPIEVVDPVGVARIDVAEANVFADHSSIFGLDQAVIAAPPRTAFGLLDQQFLQQLGDGNVDELAAVVAVEAANAKRKLAQHRLQYRLQIGLRDARRRSCHLPLRHLIDGIDVVDTLVSGAPSRRIALMHRIQAQITGLTLWLRLAPLPDRDRSGPRLDVVQTSLAVTLAAAQVVQMSHGDRSQPRILLPAVELNLAFQNAPRCRTAQALVRLVDRGQ